MTLESVIAKAKDPKTLDVALTAGGMGALLCGMPLPALAMFAKGLTGLEKHWRKEHPDFQGGLRERWQRAVEFYEQTHQNPVNRKLHMAGIPVVAAGTAGLFAFPPFTPPWMASAAAFAGGWALNFIGHGLFERNAPAFADDPLSFVAGPVWDLQQLTGLRTKPATT